MEFCAVSNHSLSISKVDPHGNVIYKGIVSYSAFFDNQCLEDIFSQEGNNLYICDVTTDICVGIANKKSKMNAFLSLN